MLQSSRIWAFLLWSALWSASAAGASAAEVHTGVADISLDLNGAQVLFFGETHGTVEAPRIVGEYIAAQISAGRRVILAVEFPASDQSLFERFMSASESQPAIQALTDGPFWRRRIQDGRTSGAMLALLDQMRKLRAKGADVLLYAVDQPRGAPATDTIVQPDSLNARDAAIASNIYQVSVKYPDYLVVVLIGSTHASKVPFDRAGRVFRPAASVVEKLVSTWSILLRARSGRAWVCRGGPRIEELTCADFEVSDAEGASVPTGFDSVHVIERSNAAKPALMK